MSVAVANLGHVRAKQFSGNNLALGDEGSPAFTCDNSGVVAGVKFTATGTGTSGKSNFAEASLTTAAVGSGGLTVSGSSSVAALTASAAVDAQSGLTVSSGNLAVSSGSTSLVGLTASGAVAAQNGLTVTNAATSVTALTASGAVAAQSGLTVTGGATSVAALTASGTATFQDHVSIASSKNLTVGGNLTVNGTTTTINTTNLDIEDGNIMIAKGNTSNTSDILQGAGITIDTGGSNDKGFHYHFANADSAPSNTEIVGMSSFVLSEDLMLATKDRPGRGFSSMHSTSLRSKAIHLGDPTSTKAGHWMIVADIENSKLQFWYGTHLPDDVALSSINSSIAKLAFEINAPA